MRRLNLFWSVPLLAAMSLHAHADTASLQPVADTTLQEAFPDNNLGGGPTVTAGTRRKGGATRALILFDIAASIPAGATIDSASLVVTVSSTPAGGANSTFDLHRLSAAWGEGAGSDRLGGDAAGPGEASWNDRLGPGTPWTTPGGDFSQGISAAQFVTGNGIYSFLSNSNLINDVQSWLDNPTNNFGWILMSESEGVPASIRRLGSREDPTTTPLLVLQYSVPEPTVPSLLTIGLGLLGLSRRSRK